MDDTFEITVTITIPRSGVEDWGWTSRAHKALNAVGKEIVEAPVKHNAGEGTDFTFEYDIQLIER